MKKILSILFFATLLVSSVFSQSLDEDASIVYMKANVLLESGRYDEAVRMYNRVLDTDDSYYQAYLMRATAKYELGAYKGTKKDAMRYIEEMGINKTVIKLMAKTESKLENHKAARNYASTSVELDPYDSDQNMILGSSYFDSKNKSEACEYWSRASNLGNDQAAKLMEKHCNISSIVQEMRKEEAKRKKTRKKQRPAKDREDDDIARIDPTRIDSLRKPERGGTEVSKLEVPVDGVSDDREMEETAEIETNEIESPDMDATNEIVIDEELTVVVGNGLGTRRIEEQPDIFMLSNEEGRVVINVCVDGKGNVSKAELDRSSTTLHKQGLISLALRKSKEFEFFPSFREDQCGFIIFAIKKANK